MPPVPNVAGPPCLLDGRQVIGWVHQVPVTEDEAKELEASTPPPPALAHDPGACRRWARRSVLVRALLGLEARHRGLGGVDDLVMAVTSTAVPEDFPPYHQVQAYAKAQTDGGFPGERRLVRHVLVATEAEAAAMVARLEAGDELAKVARECSLDRTSAPVGGLMGWLSRGELVGPVEDACFLAPLGQVTGPVRGPFGWHVLVVEEVSSPARPSQGDLEERARQQLRQAARAQAWACWLQGSLRTHVRVPPGMEHPCMPWPEASGHRH